MPTRFDRPGARWVVKNDPDGHGTYIAVIAKSGSEVYKNRSVSRGGVRQYDTHLTERQKVLIRWALRQLTLGHKAGRIADALNDRYGWTPGPGQFPVSAATIRAWMMTRRVEAKKGRIWPKI
jgi:hypothetical protein